MFFIIARRVKVDRPGLQYGRWWRNPTCTQEMAENPRVARKETVEKSSR
jgi:hypothetical protein